MTRQVGRRALTTLCGTLAITVGTVAAHSVLTQLGVTEAVVSILAVAQTPPAGQATTADFDLAAVENGGHVEWASSQVIPQAAAVNLITGRARYWYGEGNSPDRKEEIVFSFFSRHTALVASVQINPFVPDNADRPKDIEIWTSVQSPTAGFVRAGGATLKNADALQTIAFPAVEAKYVSVRILNTYPARDVDKPGDFAIAASRVRILEGSRAGYVSVLARNPELASVLKGVMPGAPAPAAAALPAASVTTCAAPTSEASVKKSTYPQSRNVLVVANRPADYKTFVWKFAPNDTMDMQERISIAGVNFSWVPPTGFVPAQLVADPKIDTVVFAQVCGINDDLQAASKQALLAWVAAGHKVIIQDSDYCAGANDTPTYSFMPYPFATSNPGAAGAAGVAQILENSTLASANRRDAGFVDVDSWMAGVNDLGDSNVVVQYDAHWCGAIWAQNKLGKNGFAVAYAHYGRGLIVYDGTDSDQYTKPAYRQLQTRELMQPFDADNLSCSQPLGGFVIATKADLKSQPMAASRTYTYPLSILGNFGYTGRVTLEAGVTPADPAIGVKLDRTAIDLTKIDEATASLTVTTAATAALTPTVISVRGRDAAGKSNILCLALPERKTGSVTIVSEMRKKPPTKNLEIILDASGSMRTMLGAQTRWATAQQVLKDVVSKLPKDFSVGLRAYGHTLPSTDPGTCTDSALVVPVAPLNPAALLAAATKLAPRGETPLVYSILQTPADLQDAGGGTVILITDGEESCKGDFAAAAKALKDAGMNLTLNIVGFTLNNAPAQAALSGLAESTGGHYYGASSGAALARAVLLAAVDRLPYRVLDAAGKEVARGEAGVDDAHELAPGTYTVIVSAGDQDVRLPITIALGQDLRLKAAIKGDRLVIER